MIKFFYQPYQNKQFWSNKKHKYYTSYNIKDQIWDSPEQPCLGESLTIYEILPKLPKNATKATRSAIMRFPTTTFPLKEYVGYNQWNGIIFVDMDMIHSKLFCDKIDAIVVNDKVKSYNEAKNNQFYEALKSILFNLYGDNFFYIERSSSGIGLHIMLYFDIDKTKENFFKCAEYCKWILMNKISNNDYGIIKDFDKMISESKVFDGVYNRIYQKCYITGIDGYINGLANGSINIDVINDFAVKNEINNEVNDNVKSNYKISSSRISKMKDGIYDVDHNDRFYIYTALKKVTKSKDECNAIWTELCKKFKLYKNYTYNQFVNEFDYDSIDESTAHIHILSKYGIDIKQGETCFHLDDQYLGDIKDELLNGVVTGINHWRAPTGSGKTVFWTSLNKEILNDVLGVNMNKPILIVEPLNSIINTKYDNNVVTVTGSKRFPKYFTGYGMYVTNYNKLLKKVRDHFELRPDIEEFFSNFEYIVIDESHIIIKDAFRCDVLIAFINTLQKISKKCKVILQTASPMDEDLLFKIKNKIIITKKPKAEIKYITRFIDNDKFSIQDLNDITKYYISQNRKVYIYWNNASLTQLKSFKATYSEPDKVAIYHKRNMGEISMERISKYHLLEYDNLNDKSNDTSNDIFDNNSNDELNESYHYDILLSSVYFGVGNDLDDYCKAAVIIVGNNTVQEDIQAIGRWRNSEDIEVCQIVLQNEYEFVQNTKDNKLIRKKLLSEERDKLQKMWHDKLSKNKSILIGGKTFIIKDQSDIEILAIMKSADIYYSSFSTKMDILEDPYYNIRCKHDIDRPLEVNTDLNQQTKDYWKSIKSIRNVIKRDIVTGKVNYDDINKDSNIERFYHLWNKLKAYKLDKIIDLQYICSNSNYNKLNVWMRYYRGCISNSIDYPELYALLWYVKWFDENDEDRNIKIFGKEITLQEYYQILAYIIFVHNKNKQEHSYRILFNYFGTFKWYCKLFSQLPKELIDMFYRNEKVDMTPTKIFFDENDWKDEDFENNVITCLDDILNQMTHMNKTEQEIVRIVKGCLFYINDKRAKAGKSGGEKCKKIKITDKFKHPEKYNLEIGQEFESCSSLAKYAHKNINTISQWVKKEWVESM